MVKNPIPAIEEFDEFAERGRRVVAHYCNPNCLFRHKKKQALRVALLGGKIAKLVALEAKSSNKPEPNWRLMLLQRLQKQYVSILRDIGGRARVSSTGFKLDIKKEQFLQIEENITRADSLLGSFERAARKPFAKKKETKARRRK